MRDDPDDRRDRDDPRDPERLDDRVEELETRVRELRTELGRPPEGPLGLPRPPTPREVLSFTGEYAIPTAIAMLEANVRALKALQQVIRLVDPERSVVDEERDRLQSRAADASRLTLDRLESALEDVETTIRESDLPRDDEARGILDDARRINREIRDRIERERREVDEERRRERDINRERGRTDPERDDSTGLDGGTTIELTDESDREDEEEDGEQDAADDDSAEVDVEAELESIKDEMENRQREDRSAADDADEDASDETDEAAAGEDAETEGSDADTGDDGGSDDADGSHDSTGA
ncbi:MULTISPECIES: hypothetical protein [Halorussus]|uniref:DUF7547 family protein n=1 Tax=Halorussus TaxID=1070314 RepID=UPI0018785C1F|nr:MULTISPECIES: hypothetical protein [Halorussus]